MVCMLYIDDNELSSADVLPLVAGTGVGRPSLLKGDEADIGVVGGSVFGGVVRGVSSPNDLGSSSAGNSFCA